MDYEFTTSPQDFVATLADQDIPAPVKAAIQATWDATPQTDPSYDVHAATGELWTVVRVAAVRES